VKNSAIQELKQFTKYVAPYKLFYIFTLFSMLIQTILSLIQPLYYKKLVDDVLNAPNPHDRVSEFLVVVSVLAAIRISVTILGMLNTIFNTKVMTSSVNALEYDILRKLHALPMRYHDKHASGEIFPRLYNDPPVIMSFFIGFIPQLLSSLIKAIIVFFIIMSHFWWAGLAALLPVIPMWFIGKLNVRYFKDLSDKQFKKNQFLYTRVIDMLTGIRIVRIFKKSAMEMTKFKSVQKDVRDLQVMSAVRSSWMSPLISNVGKLGGAIIFIAGSARILHLVEFADKDFTLGTLFMILSYVWQLAGPVTNIARFSGEFGGVRGATARVSELLLEEEIQTDAGLTQCCETGNIVDFNNVNFSYTPGKEILSDISFTIKKGSKIGLVGPSGSGKTTILNLICGFYPKDSGTILVNGYTPFNLRNDSGESSFISLAMQNGDLFQGTVRENLCYSRTNITEKEVWDSLKLVEADKFTATLPKGLDTPIGEGSKMLSSGQMQRLSLARAVLADSPLLILDEATSWIDLWTEQRIFNKLLQKYKERTIICISHRLHLMQLMDQVMVIRDGKLVHQDTHKNLVAKDEFYSASWELRDFDGS